MSSPTEQDGLVDPWPVVEPHELSAISTEQMREIDRIMVQELGIDLPRMMERAGLGLAEVARALCPWRPGARIAVLGGGGNNGGGGLVAARHLHGWGAGVTVVLDRPRDALGGVPRDQLEILDRLRVHVVERRPRTSPS
jgi:NAD(P)H-hydrate epimerase